MKTIFPVVTLPLVLALMAPVTPAARQSLVNHPNAAFMTSQPVLSAIRTQDISQQNQTAQPQPEPEEPTSSGRLPLTEGPLPLFAILGFFSIGGIVVLRKISRILF
jgi:hypothetical protein